MLPLHHSRGRKQSVARAFLRIPGKSNIYPSREILHKVEPIADDCCPRRLVRDITAFLGFTALVVSIGGGMLMGRHEYKDHNYDRAAAEAHARECFSKNRLGTPLFYITKPGRHIAYSLLDRQ
jgi:hypothetical protein